ncbi:MAG: branched-chain amino acid ABC transporter permease [Burkholderiaceae bacterium]|nr:branched-chain amino acid ABC transporter permease [Burkholderiaceae bacterium]
MFELTFKIVVNGLMSSLVYILMALGFTLIFGIMRIVNFAHGELYMIAAFLVYVLVGSLGWNYYLVVVLAALGVGVFGAALERVLFRPFVGRELQGMIMALAVSITLQAAAFILFGPNDQSVPRPISGVFDIGTMVIPRDRVAVGASALVILGAFYAFMRYTKTGLAMRAVVQDEAIASIYGVRPKLIHPLAFGMGAMLAGFAGALMAPIYTIHPYMGAQPMLKAFIVVILGGLGSVPGAVLGGVVLGLLESTFATLINTTVATMVSFGIVVVILLFKPTGLLGR